MTRNRPRVHDVPVLPDDDFEYGYSIDIDAIAHPVCSHFDVPHSRANLPFGQTSDAVVPTLAFGPVLSVCRNNQCNGLKGKSSHIPLDTNKGCMWHIKVMLT